MSSALGQCRHLDEGEGASLLLAVVAEIRGILLAIGDLHAKAVNRHQPAPCQPCALRRPERARFRHALEKLSHNIRSQPLPGLAEPAGAGHLPPAPPGPEVLQPGDQLAHNLLVAVSAEEGHGHHEINHYPRRQLALPDLRSSELMTSSASSLGTSRVSVPIPIASVKDGSSPIPSASGIAIIRAGSQALASQEGNPQISARPAVDMWRPGSEI